MSKTNEAISTGNLSSSVRQDLMIQLKVGDNGLINNKIKRPFIYRTVFSFMSIIDKAINQGVKQ